MIINKKKKIIELWNNGYGLMKIANMGYTPKLIDETLKKYTTENAKKWLKKGG